MKPTLCAAVAACLAVLAAPLWAQVPQPKLSATQPAGARAGATVDLKLLGSDFDGADRLVFSHPGITAQPVMTEANRYFPEPRLTETRFKVAVGADVPPGIYEVRAAGQYGVSNARRFVVGDLEEALEKEPNNEVGQAQDIALGSVMNGACDPQNFDVYKLAVKKGQRIIVDCVAQRIDSRALAVLALLDASGREVRRVVATRSGDPLLDFTAEADGPCWIRVHDLVYRGGDELAYRLAVTAGPWIDYAEPPVLQAGADNPVTIYGRNLPGGSAVEGLQADGRPLEKLVVTIKAPAEASAPAEAYLRPADASADFFIYRLATPLGASNPVRFMLGDERLVTETEPNDLPDKGQVIQPPVQIVGRFFPQSDRDWFMFDAKKDEKLWIEIYSARLGLPTDPEVVLQQLVTNDKGESSGKDIQVVDDQPTPMPAMAGNMEKRYRMSPEDPAFLFTVPADGKYRVLVRDLYGSAQGDPRHFYRLVMRPARPDFRLVAWPIEAFPAENKIAPTTCVLRRGGSDRVRVVVFRREGFAGAIRVEPESLPPGVTARAAVIGAADTSVDLVLAAAADAPAFAGPLRLMGKSDVDGKAVARPVRGAEVLWGVADTQKDVVSTRLTDSVGLAVDAKYVAPLAVQLGTGDAPLRMSRGGKLKVPVKLVKNADFKDIEKVKVTFAASGLPGKGQEKPMAAKDVVLEMGKAETELELDITEKAPLGQVSFFVAAGVDVPFVRNPERAKRAAEDQKRIDTVAAEVAAEAKAAAEARQKAEQEAAAATKDIAKAKESGAQEAVLKSAEDKLKAAEEAKAKAAEAEKKLADLVKLGEQYKKEAAAEVKATSDASKEKKLKVWVASLPATVEVVPFPITTKASADSVTVKPGEQADLTLDLKREFGFADEVKFDLTAPSGVALKLAAPVAFAGDAAHAKVTIAADKAVKPGSYTVTLRAAIKFNAKALTFDHKLEVKVE